MNLVNLVLMHLMNLAKPKFLFLFICLIGICGYTKDLVLTREYLTSNSKIPEKRSFAENPQVPACENFYEHVCSKEIAAFTLPQDRSNWTFSFSDNAERLLQSKKNYFLAFGQGYKPKTQFGRELQSFYTSCMNDKAATTEENTVIQRELSSIEKIKSPEQWIRETSLKIKDPGANPFKFTTTGNLDQPEYLDLIVTVEMRSLGERSLYQRADVAADFKKLIQQFFEALKLDQAEKRANDVFEVEKQFADLYPTPLEERLRISLHTEKTYDDFQKKYPHLKITQFLKPYVSAKTKFRDFAPETMEFLEANLDKIGIEKLKNALLFYRVQNLLDDGYPEFRKSLQAFRAKYLGAPPVRPERQERCTTEMMSKFPMELDTELIPILFPNFPEDKVVEIVQHVRDAILDGIKKNTWLSASAREEALKKIKDAHLFLVKPREPKDWNYNILAKYSLAKVHANRDLWEKKRAQKDLSELGHLRNRDQWEMGPLTLNAYYDPTDNKFVLLQGILQNPFFDPSSSEVENFGGIGAVIGHELGHSIDDQGSRYDSTGKLHEWMTPEDLANFKSRSQIFVDRFNAIKHNGYLTLGENIGDHVGLTFAHDAAFASNEKASEADQQKFFTSFAKLWCGVQRPEYVENYLKTNPHALGSARVNEQVIHQPAFSEAFHCKKGDKMYLAPASRARVW